MITPLFVIMHDRRREERMLKLDARLRRSGVDMVLIADGSGMGPWQSLKIACWIAINDPSKPTHLIALQDDAVIGPNFPALATERASIRPDDVIYLFASTDQAALAIDNARNLRRSWAKPTTDRGVIGTVGIVMPTQVCYGFLGWGLNPGTDLSIMQVNPERPLSGDTRLWVYLRDFRERLGIIAVPSIVDHDDGGDPLSDSKKGPRRAHWYVPDGGTPDDGRYL